LERLPLSISHWLGYRSPIKVYKPPPLWRVWIWSFVGAWIGICVLEVVFLYGSSFEKRHVPMLIGSFGASSVLLYGAIEAPLSQPRNVVGGHLIGSLVGVILCTLLQRLPNFDSVDQQEAVRWVAGATAVALTVVLMQITKTMHPPAGATAVLAVVQDNVVDIGWLYIGVVILSAVLQLVIALLVNNIERRYPLYWWSPPLP
ncbi:HPP family protein, partial [Phycomyces blakesleeanus]